MLSLPHRSESCSGWSVPVGETDDQRFPNHARRFYFQKLMQLGDVCFCFCFFFVARGNGFVAPQREAGGINLGFAAAIKASHLSDEKGWPTLIELFRLLPSLNRCSIVRQDHPVVGVTSLTQEEQQQLDGVALDTFDKKVFLETLVWTAEQGEETNPTRKRESKRVRSVQSTTSFKKPFVGCTGIGNGTDCRRFEQHPSKPNNECWPRSEKRENKRGEIVLFTSTHKSVARTSEYIPEKSPLVFFG